MDTPYQEYIYKSRYARWLEKEQRRETWPETVERYTQYFLPRVPKKLQPEFKKACEKILKLEVMPSMRALWTAGPALDRDNIAGYNCAYLQIDHPKAFAEMLYILMNGTGVGYSVERQYINQLPEIPPLKETDETIVFVDSKKGWAEGFYKYLRALWSGKIPKYDLSKIRPKGSILKTFGGRASGPEPLQDLLEHTRKLFNDPEITKLNSLQCHDLCCRIASCVVVGGVRRSACISLSNLSDDRMAKAKTGDFYNTHPYRSNANISVAYTEKPSSRKLISEWLKLIESQCGERGIFNREAAEHKVANIGRRTGGYDWGLNPCGEIILRPMEFCNLSEVVIRPEDTKEDLLEKVEYATILGVMQSTLTKFNFISRSWKRNCEEERLLGVSLTGLQDHPILQAISQDSKMILTEMKERAIETARLWAKALRIKVPAAITCIKPSGTVSQLVDTSSGLHARHAPFYIRRVQSSMTDPLTKLLSDSGMKAYQVPHPPNTVAFEYPVKSPENAKVTGDWTAIEQLEYWKMIRQYWCEHNPSCTIYVKENEWTQVLSWIDNNWSTVCGLSFMPYTEHAYHLAPYEEIDEDRYDAMCESLPSIDYAKLDQYERDDQTIGAQELACVAGGCEI